MYIDSRTVVEKEGLPEQMDGGSCGVLAPILADCMSLSVPMSFGQQDIRVLRVRLDFGLFVDVLVCTPAHAARLVGFREVNCCCLCQCSRPYTIITA